MLFLALLAACAQPPAAELAAAELAVAQAIEADAETWAKTELDSARESLDQAKRLIETREYPQAREALARATRSAEKAATVAGEAQARAQTESHEEDTDEEAGPSS